MVIKPSDLANMQKPVKPPKKPRDRLPRKVPNKKERSKGTYHVVNKPLQDNLDLFNFRKRLENKND